MTPWHRLRRWLGNSFEACEAGKGWEVCKDYCQPNATFSAQAEPLSDIRSLQQYTEWMKGLVTIIPDGRYEIKSFATDEDRKNVSAYGVFSGHPHRAGWPRRAHRQARGVRHEGTLMEVGVTGSST